MACLAVGLLGLIVGFLAGSKATMDGIAGDLKTGHYVLRGTAYKVTKVNPEPASASK